MALNFNELSKKQDIDDLKNINLQEFELQQQIDNSSSSNEKARLTEDLDKLKEKRSAIQSKDDLTNGFDVSNQSSDSISSFKAKSTQSISDEDSARLDNEINKINTQVDLSDADVNGLDLTDKDLSENDVAGINNTVTSTDSLRKNSTDPTLPTDDVTQESSMTSGFESPWDGRFKFSYINTQQIGNKMPIGSEFQGSPSLMNDMALIRFSHIAGNNHHKYLLDQEGSPSFSAVSNTVSFISTKDKDMQKVVVNDDNTVDKDSLPDSLSKYKEGNGNIYKDENDVLYAEIDDPNVEIWESAGKKTINVNVNSVGNSRPGLRGPSTITVTTALVEEYWLKEKGWVACEYLGVTNYYPTAELCQYKKDTSENNKSTVQLTPEKIAEYEKQIEEAKAELKTRLEENWSFKQYGKTNQKVQKANTSPTIVKEIEPTFSNLCNEENWRGNEQFNYHWKDFLYTSQYGFIPNNRMVTLRRFPMPVIDSGKLFDSDTTGEYLVPIATAINWFGEETGMSLSELLGMEFKLNWDELDADERQDDNMIEGNEQGADDGPFGGLPKALLGLNVITSGGTSGVNDVNKKNQQVASEWKDKYDPYTSGKYVNKIFGPVNRITKTKVRKSGMEFDQTISLNFSYDLKSIGGINPKAAMLDIMANMLALTYADGDFWGGDIRYFPQSPQYPFAGGADGQKAFYNSDVGGYIDALSKTVTTSLSNLAESMGEFLSDPIAGIKKLATGVGALWMAKKVDQRPNILGIKALMTGEPVGEWHLTIGNPFNPIAMIGNLIVTNVNMSFGDILGADDFPETIKFAVTLEHGLPRDKGAIESMFNRGGGKLHWAYQGQATESWNKSFSSTDGSDSLGTIKTTGTNAMTGETVDLAANGSTNLTNDEIKSSSEPTGNMMPSKTTDLSTTSTYKKAMKLAETVSIKNIGD